MKKLLLLIFVISGSIYSLDMPVLYQCSGILVEQQQNGRIHRKGIATQNLYLKIEHNMVKLYGFQKRMSICKEFPILHITRDTLFINTSGAAGMYTSSVPQEVKVFVKKDTLLGNYDFLNNSITDTIAVKVPVKKMSLGYESRLQLDCKK